MPLKWEIDPEKAPVETGAFLHDTGTPLARAILWPHRSLPRKGMAGVIGFAFVMIMIPTLPLLGSPALWGLLPFTLGAVWLLWFFLERSYRGAQTREDLIIWADLIEIRRSDPGGQLQRWAANPFWVRVSLRETGGPVESYITLNGAGREVELGAFLSPEERQTLYRDLKRALARLTR